MIKTSYLHEYDTYDQFMGETHYLLLESKDTLDALIKIENTIASKIYFGESVDGEMIMLENEQKNIFTRIGELIISTFNAFIDLLKGIGGSLKSTVTDVRKKTTDDEYKQTMQDNPELAKDFLKAFMSGNIKAHDVKDMNALLDEATNIANSLVDGKIDEKTAGQKIDESLEKWSTRAKAVSAIIAVPAAIIGLISGGLALKDREVKNKRDEEKHQYAKNSEERAATKFNWEIVDREAKEKFETLARRTGMRLGNIKTAQDIRESIKRIKDDANDKHNNGIIDKTEYDSRIAEANNLGSMLSKILAAKEYTSNDVYGDYYSEAEEANAGSITGTIQKILAWITEHITFCDGAISKLKSLEEKIQSKVKTAKDSNSGSIINSALGLIRKVMGAITKELTNIRNLSNKAQKAL